MVSETTLLTAEDLLGLPDDGRRYELLDGRLVEMAPAGNEHGGIVSTLTWLLYGHVAERNLGRVVSADPGVILRRNPDRVRAPDVCYYPWESLPDDKLPRGYSEIVPALIVEVVSPNDSASEVQDKVQEWLQAGARLVWTVYPDNRSVVAYRGFGAGRIYTEDEILDAEPVLPDFTCPVARLFE